MASSGTEVRWAGPGLGKGPPQRRRWAWSEEKDAERSSPRGWADERPFPSATSPELLEDFRLAQQHVPALEWAPGPQESGGSSGEGESDPTPTCSGVLSPDIPASRRGSGGAALDVLIKS